MAAIPNLLPIGLIRFSGLLFNEKVKAENNQNLKNMPRIFSTNSKIHEKRTKTNCILGEQSNFPFDLGNSNIIIT